MIVGTEWLVEAIGCKPELLRDETLMRAILDRIIDDLGLRPLGSVWHTFEGECGVTGLIALTESHLACHTYPEHGTATFNLYCCRERPEWDWRTQLVDELGAASVLIQKIERGSGIVDTDTDSAKSTAATSDANGNTQRRTFGGVL